MAGQRGPWSRRGLSGSIYPQLQVGLVAIDARGRRTKLKALTARRSRVGLAVASGAAANIRYLKRSSAKRERHQDRVARIRARLDAAGIPHLAQPEPHRAGPGRQPGALQAGPSGPSRASDNKSYRLASPHGERPEVRAGSQSHPTVFATTMHFRGWVATPDSAERSPRDPLGVSVPISVPECRPVSRAPV